MPTGRYYTLTCRPGQDSKKATVYSYSRSAQTGASLGPPRRLTAVKETLYNPKLPTLRRMDMDEAMRLLPDEHSRFMTQLRKEDFRTATITLFKPAETPMSGSRITETGRDLQSRGYTPLEKGGLADFIKRQQPDEEDYRQITPFPTSRNEPREPYSYMPEQYINYSTEQLKFNNYATRYLKPRITGGWRYSLKQEPFVDLRGQRPIPANIYSRYRNPHARDCLANSPWK
ncbi:predicted protein [Nematostella vectensis]|uniref:TEPP protein n=1 Tax=Nematostella vectensis TaxID=45351 RepID=A7RMH1_NEMVE|nr:testis, prostate and placenta-expressed protein isoform X2 [Nematostella vectensis]EDO47341.1 predicted protein [Nematostella vectensis]|eukprot:XP_001639404.1 predicted protein [Nematostella vectensis]